MAYNTGTDPTLAELITGKFIPEKFSKDVLFHTMSKLVVADRVSRKYEKDLKMGSVVHIPVMSAATEGEVTPGTELTASDTVGTAKSITVNKWRGAKVEESEMMKIEDPVGYLQWAAKSCSYVIKQRIDTDLGALFSALAGTVTEGNDGQTFTDAIFRSLMEYLDEGDVPDEERVLIGDPSMKSDMLLIDKFVRNDYVREPVVPTGRWGTIYNMDVLITNNLTAATTGNYGVMMHREALGLAIQENPVSQIVPMPWVHKTILQIKVIYGLGELRDTFGKSFYTRKS